jgi:hypothetical protein
MDGQVRSACCCKKAKAKADHDLGRAKFESGNRCCEVRVTESTQPPATNQKELTRDHAPPPLLAAIPQPVTVPFPREFVATLPVGARAPPDRTSPPLFLWNCSFLS